MVDVACPTCGGRDTAPFRSGPDRSHGLPGWFQLVRCRACGLVYQQPRPTGRALAAYYPPDYSPHAGAGRPSLARRLGWRHGYELYRRCRFLSRHADGGRLLDVGCATGSFLEAIRDFGDWRVWGIEPGLAAARQARARDLDVVVARFEDLRLAPESLEAVTMWDVLEHLPDPVAALSAAREALRPGGHVFLNVPTLDSWDSRLFGDDWCGLDLPRHLTLFDRRTLRLVLERAGLQPVSMAHPTGSYYSVTQSSRQLLARRLPRAGLLLARWTTGPVARLVTAPYCWAAEATGHAASLTVAARRLPAA
jgi:SAM-dependent methyltransferase